MLPFIIRRVLIFPPMIFFMSIVAFAIIQAPPGNFLDDYIAGLNEQGEVVLTSQVRALEIQFGFDDPMHVQYLKWVWGILHWDLGRSLDWRLPVTELINERLFMTVLLGSFTIVLTWTMAIPIGIISAVKQYSWIDYFFTSLSYLGVGTPNFLLALIIMWSMFAYFDLRITGLFSPDYIDADWSVGRVVDMLKHIWVPMLILGTDGTARFTRIVRANLLDEMSKPYVETARAKGLPEWKVILKYPTRIALNPFISTAGWSLPELFSGSLIVATVMNLPTLGPVLLQALLAQDMLLAGAIVLILTTLTLIGTLLSDIFLAWTDPRIRMTA